MRIPRAARVCALLAFLNAACWSLITPPFLGLDEPDHFAYAQQLAEAGRLPSPSGALTGYSSEELLALQDLRHFEVRFRPEGHLIFSSDEQRALQRDLARPLPRRGPGYVGVAASEPPLYYALEAVPYELGSSGSILDRLELMRLLSALMAGLTALFVFMFLREALPTARWAWTVGGLAVAVAPLLGYASSTVNPDALLFMVSAALFYCLARAFRRGLTRRLAIAIGVLIAAGFLTKLTFIGLVPGAMVGVIVVARREARTSGMSAYRRLLAPALLIGLSPAGLYGLVNVLSNHSTFGFLSGSVASVTGGHGSLAGELSYMWQFYLPRLPGMRNDFGEIFTTRQIWFKDAIGVYGWSDTFFPSWVYGVALIPAGAIAALCIRALAVGRTALRERAAELATYATMAVGLLVLVAAAGYLAFPSRAAEFTDARYLLPMLALWGAVLALAARGAGRRWGPAAGTLIVALVIAHDLFSQLQVIARYYS
jgi:4-amino-4-deoxy-L-arabinose transferase-like glycosyltransferase